MGFVFNTTNLRFLVLFEIFLNAILFLLSAGRIQMILMLLIDIKVLNILIFPTSTFRIGSFGNSLFDISRFISYLSSKSSDVIIISIVLV